MSKKIDIQNLEIEYKDSYPKFERLLSSLNIQLNELLLSEKIKLGFPIQSRIKDLNSIIEKIESGRFNIKKSIFELQDIIGFRIILLFNKDISVIEDHIKNNLEVIKTYNTSDKLLENQFGYSSQHYIVKIPEIWLKVPTFKSLGEIQIEIQIRTISQHIWSEASNNLQYKQSENIPKEVKRSISRISALLEIIDFEFDRLLIDRDKYKLSLKDINEDAILNVDILENILDKTLPPLNKKKEENYSILIDDLKEFKITTIKELENLINLHLDEALVNDLKRATEISKRAKNNERANSGVFYAHVGLIRELLLLKFKDKWDDYNMFRNSRKK